MARHAGVQRVMPIRGATMQEPRSAGAMGSEFPYTLATMCYLEVSTDGKVRWGSDPTAHERAMAGNTRLYAVWPGRWSSHLFVIDDLDQYARAFGIVHDAARTGLADHDHEIRWAVSPYRCSVGLRLRDPGPAGLRCADASAAGLGHRHHDRLGKQQRPGRGGTHVLGKGAPQEPSGVRA
jgi:hypothetical protein